MSFILNSEFVPFYDKKGNYVEVIAVLPTKIILLYSVDKTEEQLVSDSSLYNVGDKLYIDKDGKITIESNSKLEKTYSSSNKQSPSSRPIDPFSRY